MENWEHLTLGMLRGMEWSNVFVAGGSVLACLLPCFYLEDVAGTNGFFNSDIDLFIHGLSKEDATAKIFSILSLIQKNTGGRLDHIVVSSHSITMMGIF